MKKSQFNRRRFMKDAAATAAGMMMLPGLTKESYGASNHRLTTSETSSPRMLLTPQANRIKFSVIGINHGHINSQIEAVKRGGGEFVSFFAKEPDLAAAFAKK